MAKMHCIAYHFTSIEMMTEEEMRIIKTVQSRTNKTVKWVPMAWSVNLLNELKRKKFIGISSKLMLLQRTLHET